MAAASQLAVEGEEIEALFTRFLRYWLGPPRAPRCKYFFEKKVNYWSQISDWVKIYFVSLIMFFLTGTFHHPPTFQLRSQGKLRPPSFLTRPHPLPVLLMPLKSKKQQPPPPPLTRARPPTLPNQAPLPLPPPTNPLRSQGRQSPLRPNLVPLIPRKKKPHQAPPG